ncbi:hypothetical protein V8J85_03175 [Yoonia sp. 2307UL14-13]|uniref:hypothetical protein n=1 Tax=Yoonia sp. 2307UL14-13 TaxID=3126506 RepID=UPI0030A1C2E0
MGKIDWLYDSVGNRREQSTLSGGVSIADTYSYWADSNQLDRIDLATGNARQFFYDAARNVISDKVGARDYGYTYDAANRMASFSVNGVVFAEYEYNHLGQQVVNRQVQNGQTIHSIQDAAGQRIAEYLYNDASGTSTLIPEYIWANAQIVGVVENGALCYVRTDHIGRPVFATDDTGAKVWTAATCPSAACRHPQAPTPTCASPANGSKARPGCTKTGCGTITRQPGGTCRPIRWGWWMDRRSMGMRCRTRGGMWILGDCSLLMTPEQS